MPGTVTAEDIQQYNHYNTCDKDVVCAFVNMLKTVKAPAKQTRACKVFEMLI